MGSNDMGSYELKRSPCEMQMEECSANLARSTSDGSADYYYYYHYYHYYYPPTHRWSSVLGELNILPFASHMVTA